MVVWYLLLSVTMRVLRFNEWRTFCIEQGQSYETHTLCQWISVCFLCVIVCKRSKSNRNLQPLEQKCEDLFAFQNVQKKRTTSQIRKGMWTIIVGRRKSYLIQKRRKQKWTFFSLISFKKIWWWKSTNKIVWDNLVGSGDGGGGVGCL